MCSFVSRRMSARNAERVSEHTPSSNSTWRAPVTRSATQVLLKATASPPRTPEASSSTAQIESAVQAPNRHTYKALRENPSTAFGRSL